LVGAPAGAVKVDTKLSQGARATSGQFKPEVARFVCDNVSKAILGMARLTRITL
jgi:hypothetical protein